MSIAASRLSSNGSWVDVSSLRDALTDPKQRLLDNLEKLNGEVNWRLPAGMAQRVAPPFLVRTYARYGSAVRFAKSWVQEKQLDRNHVAHEMMLRCMVLDKMISSQPDFVLTEGCEMLARRIYGLKRAFRDVHSAADWKQPKGSGGAQRRTKVR